MTFDSLINVQMPEVEIFDHVVEILRHNFSAYKDVNVCLELGEVEGDLCAVINVFFYKLNCEKDVAAKHQFMFKHEYEKIFIITKFEYGSYFTTLFGHFIHKSGDVHPTGIQHVHESKRIEDRAHRKTRQCEWISKAFDEIKAELIKKTS